MTIKQRMKRACPICFCERHLDNAGHKTKIALREVDDGNKADFSLPYATAFSRQAENGVIRYENCHLDQYIRQLKRDLEAYLPEPSNSTERKIPL